MLKFKNICKTYNGRQIINDFSLNLPNTGLVLFHGENGSGKTTLLKIISNNIKFKGNVEFPEGVSHKDIYYLSSEEDLLFNLTVKSKANFLLDKSELDIFYNYIQKYDLEYLLDYKLHKLSSGEKQKIEMLYLFSKHKSINLLDEPLEYVDKESKGLFIQELKELSKDTLVIVSSPKDYIDADCVLEFEKNFISAVLYDKDEGENLINSKQKHFKFTDYIKLFFNKKSIISSIFTLVVTTLILFTSICINMNNITKSDQLKSVLKNDPGIYLTNSNGKRSVINSFDNEPNNVYNNQRIKITTKLCKITPFNILESDNIYVNGINTKVNDYEVYISDYLYDMVRSTELIHDGLFPGIISNNPSDQKINYEFNGYGNFNLTTKIYKTNYKEFYPTIDKNIDPIGYSHEINKFKKAYEQYFGHIIFNTNTFNMIFNSIDRVSKEELYNNIMNYEISSNMNKYAAERVFLFEYNKTFVHVGVSNNQFIDRGTVFFDLYFAMKYLGWDVQKWSDFAFSEEEKLISFEYEGYKFNNYKFKLMDVSAVGGGGYSRLYLNYDDALDFRKTLDLESYYKTYDRYDLVGIVSDDLSPILIDEKDFMSQKIFNQLQDNKLYLDPQVKTLAINLIITILVLIIIFYFMGLKKEKETVKFLYNKGYIKSESIMGVFIIKLLLFLILSSIAVILSFYIYEALSIIFNILI